MKRLHAAKSMHSGERWAAFALCSNPKLRSGRLHKSFVLLTLLIFVLSTGCVTRTVRARRDQACSSLAALTTAIAALRRVSNTTQTSAATIKQYQERVTVAFNDLTANLRGSGTEEFSDLQEAYTDLNKVVVELPNQSTVGQATVVITDNIVKVEAASIRVKGVLRC